MQHIYSEKWQLSIREKRGLIFLLSALMISILMPLLWRICLNHPTAEKSLIQTGAKTTSTNTYKYTAHGHQKSTSYRNKTEETPITTMKSVEMQSFDPNLLSHEDARQMGIPEHVFRMLERYRKHGGRFKKAQDLQKIYAMTPELYARLKPWITIAATSESTHNQKHHDTNSYQMKNNESIRINQASAEEWESLPGIGTLLATRIVRFRDALGGFLEARQLSEVYGITDSSYQRISARLICDKTSIRKIEINHVDVDELEKHPYITRKQARLLVNYRRQHQKISGIAELSDTGVFTDDWLQKISPYLSFD